MKFHEMSATQFAMAGIRVRGSPKLKILKNVFFGVYEMLLRSQISLGLSKLVLRLAGEWISHVPSRSLNLLVSVSESSDRNSAISGTAAHPIIWNTKKYCGTQRVKRLTAASLLELANYRETPQWLRIGAISPLRFWS